MSKTVLFGAIGRHNLGDLLFAHIVARMIRDSGIETDIHFCDLLARDMTPYGGHDVESISSFLDVDDLNVVHIGGQTGNLSVGVALKALEEPAAESGFGMRALKHAARALGITSRRARRIKRFLPIHRIRKRLLRGRLVTGGRSRLEAGLLSSMEVAYLLPKALFRAPGLFVANSIGGNSGPALRNLANYDYVGFRDRHSYMIAGDHEIENLNLAPDCAVLTRYLFEELIAGRSNREEVRKMRAAVGNDYVAIQINAGILDAHGREIEEALSSSINRTGLPIVLFCAGIARWHDSPDQYRAHFTNGLKQGRIYFFDDYDIWDICHVISNAALVIGTSLHVRIIASLYERRRSTLCAGHKQNSYINEWDFSKEQTQPERLCDDAVRLLSAPHDKAGDRENTLALERLYLEMTFLNKGPWADRRDQAHRHGDDTLGAMTRAPGSRLSLA